MSHSHTHAPGESHSHSHGPPQPQPQPQVMQAQAQHQISPFVDPTLQAAIEQDFRPVEIKLGNPKEMPASCGAHGLEKCSDCNADFVALNTLTKLFVANPNLPCPPPPQVVQQQRSQAVTKAKEDGNALFKGQKHQQAIGMYTMAAAVASQRLPWEPSQLMREELATVLSNRSAASLAAGDYTSALADAELVIQLKRPWSKGWFRKSKTLMEMGQLQDAKDAIKMGLSYEPTNAEMVGMLKDINEAIKKKSQIKS